MYANRYIYIYAHRYVCRYVHVEMCYITIIPGVLVQVMQDLRPQQYEKGPFGTRSSLRSLLATGGRQRPYEAIGAMITPLAPPMDPLEY